MPDKIHEIFPECFERTRRKRGREAISKIISHPTFEEMCENLFKNTADMLIFNKWRSRQYECFCSVYRNRLTDAFGLFYTSWCDCGMCLHPIKRHSKYDLLQEQYEAFYHSVFWYKNAGSLIQNVPNLVANDLICNEIIDFLRKNAVTE